MPTIQVADVTNAVEDALGLSFPRCCICNTLWYDALDGEDDEQSTRKRKKNRSRPSHEELISMPPCNCTTKLVLPSSVPCSIYSEKECSDPVATLSQIKTLSYPSLAICRTCLEKRIKASNEVTEHDYRQEHIPNGQQNVKFTVEPDCVQCKRKFVGRVLERLLASNGESCPTRASGKGKTNTKWSDAVKSTIDTVGWVKREVRRDRRDRRTREKSENAATSTLQNNEQRKTLWETYSDNDGNGSSDDCYSYSSDDFSDDELDARKKGPHRIESESGELAKYLAEKDPKFKQELEDKQFVMKLAEEEEKKRQKELEATKGDHEYAMKVQADYESSSKEKVKGKVEARQTRKRRTIVDAMNKASATKERSPKPTSGRKKAQQTTIVDCSAQSSLGVAKMPKTELEVNDEDDDGKLMKLREITNMGFPEESARRCLNDADGVVEVAVSMLLSEANEREPAGNGIKRNEVVRIMFTGIQTTRRHMQMIETIGAKIVESIDEAHTATHVIVKDDKVKFRRTPKFLVCVCKTPNIVTMKWLEQCAKEQRILETTPYLLIGDEEVESRYDFSMKKTIQNGIRIREKGGVLGGFYVYICEGVAGNKAPNSKELKLIIEAAGGQVLQQLSTYHNIDPTKVMALTSDPSTPAQQRDSEVRKILKSGGKTLTTSWLFRIIITQCINPVIELD